MRRISRKLSFPRHAYLVDDGHLAAYALKSGTLSTYALVPPRSATGALRVPHHLVHSTAKGAWLLFCRTAAADGAFPARKLGSSDVSRVHGSSCWSGK